MQVSQASSIINLKPLITKVIVFSVINICNNARRHIYYKIILINATALIITPIRRTTAMDSQGQRHASQVIDNHPMSKLAPGGGGDFDIIPRPI